MKRDVIICMLLAAATVAVYSRVVEFRFTGWDDPDYIYENTYVVQGLTLDGIGWAFTNPHVGNWHPLTWLSHMVD